MNISANVLRTYIACPEENTSLRHLLDDVGIEVKKVDGDVFSVELLANRGDHYCYAGIARELSGRLGGEICLPAYTALEVGESGPKISVETDLCLVYSATYLEASESQDFSPEILAPLLAADIHSLGGPIDATNLSNMEFGQPTHVFDADRVVGTICIRCSHEGEQAWPLFAEDKIVLPTGTMVIADEEKILAIAGVIGCEESKTTENTRRIILESACFEPVHVRKTSRAISTHTTSVARFERGSDPSFPLVGAGRVVHLLEQHGWKRVGATTLHSSWSDSHRKIEIRADQANAFLGTDITRDEIVMRLQRYGFQCERDVESIYVGVPPHRIWDVETVADLYEDLAKSIGYNNTPIMLPLIGCGAQPTREEVIRATVEDILLGLGFYEVITDGFYGSNLLSLLQLPEGHPLCSHVSTKNALDRGYSLLKNNALLHAIAAVSKNIKRHIFDLKIYEWTRYFILDPEAENGLCREQLVLWGAVCGQERPGLWTQDPHKSDVFFLKGLLEEIANELRLPLSLAETDTAHPLHSSLHPFRQRQIMLRGQVVGILGEIHPEIARRFKIKKQRACYFEIETAALYQQQAPLQYTIPHAIQPLTRTVSFALPQGLSAKRIQDSIAKFCTSVQIYDLFPFVQEDEQWASVTFSLCFENPEGTLSAESVNTSLQEMISAVMQEYQSFGVYQR